MRLRDFGIAPGIYPPGSHNAITDVPGVLVGQTTLIQDTPSAARTGVTVIMPREDIHHDFVFAAVHNFNGIGEMTGLPLIEETGLLTSPVVLTNTNQVGMAYDTVVRYGADRYAGMAYKLPVIAETYDGWLNDINSFPVRPEHVIAALETASSGSVEEGNTGGGTGMNCYEFKGGTGTASRQVEMAGNKFRVGAFVQANHGVRADLLVDGYPLGRMIPTGQVPAPWPAPPNTSSVIAVIATDAPLLPNQCRRLAQRATIGLARTGGFGRDGSGDIFLAFSTGSHYQPAAQELCDARFVPLFAMDPLVLAAAEAVEEAILNALVAAVTMVGWQGRISYALPHERLWELGDWRRRNV